MCDQREHLSKAAPSREDVRDNHQERRLRQANAQQRQWRREPPPDPGLLERLWALGCFWSRHLDEPIPHGPVTVWRHQPSQQNRTGRHHHNWRQPVRPQG
ncbi:MAG: hypothetical protein WHU94_13885 [Thermogemmata sp.]